MSSKFNKLVVACLAFAMLASFAGTGAGVSADPTTDPTSKYDEHLRAALEDNPLSVRVIVLTTGSSALAAEAARTLGAEVVWEYTVLDGFAADVPASALDDIALRADVEQIQLDRPVVTVMNVSHRAIEADKAWSSGYTGKGVTVAVIDTGIDMLHPFFPSGTVVACVATIAGAVSPECQDSDGHGTHVAGSVASRSTQYPGIAKEANLAVVRVLHAAGTGLTSDIIAGMNWVRNNKDAVSPPIRVATMSIGYLTPGCGDDTTADAIAANNLVASGVTFTVAAGNSGHARCTVDGASAASRVITVANVDDRGTVSQEDDVISSDSSGGPTADGRLKPDVSFPGTRITSAFIGGGLLIATMSGTSMATPHAAGTAALMLQQDPALTPDELKDRMLSTTVKNANTGPTANNVYGHGLGNACLALELLTCTSSLPPPPLPACSDGIDNDDDGKVDYPDDPGCDDLEDADETDPLPPPDYSYVAGVDMSFVHQGKNSHRVTVAANVLASTGEPVANATVAFYVTSPEEKTYTGTATTDDSGVASLTVRQTKDGHGVWEGCVATVNGASPGYDRSYDVERCETLDVT